MLKHSLEPPSMFPAAAVHMYQNFVVNIRGALDNCSHVQQILAGQEWVWGQGGGAFLGGREPCTSTAVLAKVASTPTAAVAMNRTRLVALADGNQKAAMMAKKPLTASQPVQPSTLAHCPTPKSQVLLSEASRLAELVQVLMPPRGLT